MNILSNNHSKFIQINFLSLHPVEIKTCESFNKNNLVEPALYARFRNTIYDFHIYGGVNFNLFPGNK